MMINSSFVRSPADDQHTHTADQSLVCALAWHTALSGMHLLDILAGHTCWAHWLSILACAEHTLPFGIWWCAVCGGHPMAAWQVQHFAEFFKSTAFFRSAR